MSVLLSRVLDPQPVASLDAYLEMGGGDGRAAATKLGPAATIEELEASGLRGRGGAGFPTGTKWRTVAANASPTLAATVVVNGAEGEPGSFKDRELLSRNPYRVLEGALIAADTVGADRVIVAVKSTFAAEIARLQQAIAELAAAGWADGSRHRRRRRARRVPVRRGDRAPRGRGRAAAVPARRATVPPRCRRARRRRRLGGRCRDGRRRQRRAADAGQQRRDVGQRPRDPRQRSILVPPGRHACIPGTIVCTVTGSTQRAGVGEVAMGTPLRTVIDWIGGGPAVGANVRAVLSGVAHPMIPAAALDTPLTYEDMEAAGSALGAAGFIVFDDSIDVVAVAQGVSRFLAIESCGQCTPCKQDGLAIAALLEQFCASNATDDDLAQLATRVDTVADEARCFLAHQQQRVIGSLLALFPDALTVHMEASPERTEAVTPVLIAPLTSVGGDVATVDEDHRTKQPDWTHDPVDSGVAPADRLI